MLWLGDLQIEEVNREVITSGQEVETCNNQVTELRRQLQALEIDLQAQLSQVRAKLTAAALLRGKNLQLSAASSCPYFCCATCHPSEGQPGVLSG